MQAKFFIVFFLLCFCFAVPNLQADDAAGQNSITKAEISAGLGWDYSRQFRNEGEVFLKGGLQFIHAVDVAGGYLFSKNPYYTEHVAFADAGLSLSVIPWEPLKYFSVHVLYQYLGIPEYQNTLNALIPFISFKSTYIDASVGINTLWSRFYEVNTGPEGSIALSLTLYPFSFHAFSKQKIQSGITIANFDEYYCSSMIWQLYLKLFCNLAISERLSIENNLTFLQTGFSGLTTNFEGFILRSAVKLTW
ncbi:MAG: hypothetical protein LBM77_05875 [Spirochaetaceae bacterium]|jgi:hypothetical protein|nr:hypothetical protein [Spirochaetaceae bacterium]